MDNIKTYYDLRFKFKIGKQCIFLCHYLHSIFQLYVRNRVKMAVPVVTQTNVIVFLDTKATNVNDVSMVFSLTLLTRDTSHSRPCIRGHIII